MPVDTPPRSSIYRTAERAVGDMREFLASQRASGASFQNIASALQDRNVLVTHETVRSWCQRLGIPKVSSKRPVHDGSATVADVEHDSAGRALGGRTQ